MEEEGDQKQRDIIYGRSQSMFPREEEREIEEIQISCKFSIRQGKSNLKRFPLEGPINPPIILKPVNAVINGNIIDW